MLNIVGKTKLRKIIFLISSVLLVSIIKYLLKDKLHGFDNIIYFNISKFINFNNTIITIFITTLGAYWFLFLVSTLLIIFMKDKRKSVYILMNLLMVIILNVILKDIFSRPRPDVNIIVEIGYSFPSGHSMVSTAFYGFIIFLIKHSNISNNKKIIFSCLFVLLIILIGISRVYLGVHFISDVIARYLISVIYLLIFTNLISDKLYKKDSENF